MAGGLAAAIRAAQLREAARKGGEAYRAALLARPAAPRGTARIEPGRAGSQEAAPRSPPPAAAALAAAVREAGAGGSPLVRELVGLLALAGLPPPRWKGSPGGELRPIPGRRYAVDLAWEAERVYCEVDGGAWSGGRHGRGGGIMTDCEKTSLLAGLGWRHVRVTTGKGRHVQAEAVAWIAAALAFRPDA